MPWMRSRWRLNAGPDGGCRWERTVRQWGTHTSSLLRVGGLTLCLARLGVTNDPKNTGLGRTKSPLRSLTRPWESADIQEVRALQAH